MKIIKSILLNRNSILVLAVILGLIFGDWASEIKSYTIYVLAIVMTFSLSGIDSKAFFPVKKIFMPMLVGAFLNYVVFGAVILFFAWLIVPDQLLFYGFVVIAAAPPGVAVVPFSHILKGDVNYSIIGVLGAFIASVFLAPLIVNLFAPGVEINPIDLFLLMVKLVVVPLIISRILLIKPIFPVVQKVRGKIVDWGFAIIIFTAVGMNRQVFFEDYKLLFQIFSVLFLATFVTGEIFKFVVSKYSKNSERVITQTMLLTIKSSGFSVVTAYTLFGAEASIPSAVLSVVVLMYLLFLSLRSEMEKKK